MDIFNRKKILELEYERAKLQKRIDELETIINTKGYKIPKIKTMLFRNESEFVFNQHLTTVINYMNENDIEIVNTRIEEQKNQFTIKYRLPSNIKSVNFSYDLIFKGKLFSYQPKFSKEII